jgi:hypothetical protein
MKRGRIKPKPADIPPQKVMCATCPWRQGSPYASLQESLESNRICHSTGSSAIYPKGTGVPPKMCRGARDLQLAFFHEQGFLDAPTDEAWKARGEEMRAMGCNIMSFGNLVKRPWKNMKAAVHVYWFASSTSSKTYETIRYDDGTCSCDCPGWCKRVASNGCRSCKHTRMVDAGIGVIHAVRNVAYNSKGSPVTVQPEVPGAPKVQRRFNFD